jgi:hypothetical protein
MNKEPIEEKPSDPELIAYAYSIGAQPENVHRITEDEKTDFCYLCNLKREKCESCFIVEN